MKKLLVLFVGLGLSLGVLNIYAASVVIPCPTVPDNFTVNGPPAIDQNGVQWKLFSEDFYGSKNFTIDRSKGDLPVTFTSGSLITIPGQYTRLFCVGSFKAGAVHNVGASTVRNDSCTWNAANKSFTCTNN